jgi:propanediol dehydratase large subunit
MSKNVQEQLQVVEAFIVDGNLEGAEEEMVVAIEEIARVGLTMVFDDIGVELDMSDEELLKIRDYLETKLNGER